MGRKKNTTMANKIYSKQDAVMIRGLAILCMVVLHLFCRTGKDVFGKPLLWINSTIPVVFLFGFFRKFAFRFIHCVQDTPDNIWKKRKNLRGKIIFIEL
mgnify:CR=1 FL=1